MDWIANELHDLTRRGLRRSRRRVDSVQGPRISLNGRELINFASNDYLNLAGDPRLAQAAAKAARKYGCGAGASPLVSGYLPPHRRLEKDLANFEGEESALVFSSGFAANLAIISSLVSREDAIFSDRLNHASLIDGCRLSGAAIHVYDHCDVGHLEELLKKHGPRARRRLVITESLFSMDGDMPALSEIATWAGHFEAMLLIDEAHATGILESSLRSPRLCVKKALVIRVGTLSKALGCQGGFVCGPKLTTDWLVNVARPYIFSTAISPPVCAAARRALQIVQSEPERRRHLLALAAQLRESLQAEGFDIGPSQSHIVPIIIGEPEEAVRLSATLEEHGYLVPAIRPPSVPPGTSRLRISLTAGHTAADVAGLVSALISCRTGNRFAVAS